MLFSGRQLAAACDAKPLTRIAGPPAPSRLPLPSPLATSSGDVTRELTRRSRRWRLSFLLFSFSGANGLTLSGHRGPNKNRQRKAGDKQILLSSADNGEDESCRRLLVTVPGGNCHCLTNQSSIQSPGPWRQRYVCIHSHLPFKRLLQSIPETKLCILCVWMDGTGCRVAKWGLKKNLVELNPPWCYQRSCCLPWRPFVSPRLSSPCSAICKQPER